MKHFVKFLSFLTLVLFLGATGLAQTSTSRVEKQHKATAFIKAHLTQTEDHILRALNSPFPDEGLQSPLQTVRDLEQLFPAYSFEKFIIPLENILKNDQVDPTSRMLAALALDELHSDAGDDIITATAIKSDNVGVQTLCKALLAKAKSSHRNISINCGKE